jgi:hypothetical protein
MRGKTYAPFSEFYDLEKYVSKSACYEAKKPIRQQSVHRLSTEAQAAGVVTTTGSAGSEPIARC